MYVNELRCAFVAHQRTDGAFVQDIGLQWLKLGSKWRANEVIPYIQDWKPLAAQAIRESAAFVFVATRTSLESHPCRFEWELAIELDKPIVRLDLGASLADVVPEALARFCALVSEAGNTTATARLLDARLNAELADSPQSRSLLNAAATQASAGGPCDEAKRSYHIASPEVVATVGRPAVSRWPIGSTWRALAGNHGTPSARRTGTNSAGNEPSNG